MLRVLNFMFKKNVFEDLINVTFYRQECSDKGGTNDGSCAEGYGVCCTCKY